MQGTVTIPKVQLFRAGNYGEKGVYTAADIKRLADSYDPKSGHEAPVTIDHKQEGPRFGRVLSVYADGDVLMGDLEVFDEFAQVLKRGAMDKRSIELYRDGEGRARGIRALTFLGAQPPEVKGLEALPAFSDALAFISFQEADIMADNTQDAAMIAALAAAVKAAVKEALAEGATKVEVETEEMACGDKPKMMEGEGTKEEPVKPVVKEEVKSDTSTLMSEDKNEIAALKKQVAELKRKAEVAEFAAQKVERAAKRESFVSQFSDRLTADSKAAVEALFDSLYAAAPVQFGEGNVQPVEILTKLITAIPEHNLNKQVATAPTSFGEGVADAEKELDKVWDRAVAEFREGKAGNAKNIREHFEVLVNSTKKGA